MVKFTFLHIPSCRLESIGNGEERLLISTESSVSFSFLSSFVLIEYSYSTTHSWYIATYRFHLSRVFNEIYDERKSEDVCFPFECDDDDDDDDDLYTSLSVYTNSPLSLSLSLILFCMYVLRAGPIRVSWAVTTMTIYSFFYCVKYSYAFLFLSKFNFQKRQI